MSTIIIGAGIAGLSAGYHLQQAGKEVILLEARDRIGGRCWTNRTMADIPIEFGAELIHGEHVSTWEWVDRLGLQTVHWEKQEDSLVRMEDGQLLTMEAARAIYPDFDITRSWELPNIPVQGTDESWGGYLKRIGFTKEQLQYVKRSFANDIGADMRYISARAMLIDTNYEDCGDGDYRIMDGYDTFYKALAKDLNIQLNAVVKKVEWGKLGVSVHTQNQVFEGNQVIVTLPLGVLQAGDVTFKPALPTAFQSAIDTLKMGQGLKMVYSFKKPITPPTVSAIYSASNPPMWWSPSYEHPHNGQVWTAFLTGDWARDLHVKGANMALEIGLQSLRNELNNPLIQPNKMQFVNWMDDPYSRGAYSVVTTGHLDKVALFSQPVPPLYFAGEHTAEIFETATIHGAYNTGKRAALQILNL